MKKLFIFAVALLMSSAIFAQTWQYAGVFPDTAGKMIYSGDGKVKAVPQPLYFMATGGLHGLAVDPDGKVWMQNYYATDSIAVKTAAGAEVLTGLTGGKKQQPIRVLYCFNPDGTQASFSPIKIVSGKNMTVAGGPAFTDTLGGHLITSGTTPVYTWDAMTGRGLGIDNNGNILATFFGKLYKIDYKTGKGIAKVVYDAANSGIAAVSDPDGNIFMGGVIPGLPYKVYDNDLNYVKDAEAKSGFYGRTGFAIKSTDGNVYFGRAGYTKGDLTIRKYDVFGSCDSVGTIYSACPEAIGYSKATKLVWMNTGNKVDPVNTNWDKAPYKWSYGTHYGINLDNPKNPLLVDSIVLPGNVKGTTFKPRGIAFTTDGKTAYVLGFAKDAGEKVFGAFKFTNAAPKSSGGSSLSANEVSATTVKSFNLDQNYPNPFNPTTAIKFNVAATGMVSLKVFNMLGQEVATLVNNTLTAGQHSVNFNAANLSSGTYMYQLKSGNVTITKKMMLVK